MIYELLNPSDMVTFEASDKLVAVSVCVLLGAGRFGLDAETDVAQDGFPLLIFANDEQTNAAMRDAGFERGSESVIPFVDAHLTEIADAFDSFWYCDLAERKAIMAAIGTDPNARVRYNEAKRSSVNNIGAAAAEWSKRLRERLGSKNETAEAP